MKQERLNEISEYLVSLIPTDEGSERTFKTSIFDRESKRHRSIEVSYKNGEDQVSLSVFIEKYFPGESENPENGGQLTGSGTNFKVTLEKKIDDWTLPSSSTISPEFRETHDTGLYLRILDSEYKILKGSMDEIKGRID